MYVVLIQSRLYLLIRVCSCTILTFSSFIFVAFVPLGFIQRNNKDIMNNLGNAAFQSNLGDPHCVPFLYGPSKMLNTNAQDEARASSNNDVKSNFVYEGHQSGPSAFFGMGMGYQNSNNNEGLNTMMDSPEIYRDVFANTRDVFSNGALGCGLGGGMGQHNNMYGAMPDDFKRMMLMMAMGQSPGVINNGKMKLNSFCQSELCSC